MFNHLIKYSQDSNYNIPNQDVTPVLHYAFIYQFDDVANKLIKRLVQNMSHESCLEVWSEDLPIPNLKNRAKFQALLNFSDVLQTSHFQRLALHQVCDYLGSIFLKARNEFDVVKAIDIWYSHNKTDDDTINCKMLLKLLRCVQFKSLSHDDIFNLEQLDFVQQHKDVLNVIKCIEKLQENEKELSNLNPLDVDTARKFLSCKPRVEPVGLCLILDDADMVEITNKKQKSDGGKIEFLNLTLLIVMKIFKQSFKTM